MIRKVLCPYLGMSASYSALQNIQNLPCSHAIHIENSQGNTYWQLVLTYTNLVEYAF